MPQIFRIGAYIVYFWSDEGLPTEPVHVHVAEGRPIPTGISKRKINFSKNFPDI